VPWLLLAAYTCSGLAGLVYQVSWTRVLTLYLGHTTAAASAVVGAFLGGLAVGAAIGGRLAERLTARQSLVAYIVLEVFVAAAAAMVPTEMRAVAPLLRWAYADGAPSALFPAVRLATCLLMVFVPAVALGATFPIATRWFAAAANPARASAWLYALNTAGAATGALLAGFFLIPAIGLIATLGLAVSGSLLAAALVWLAYRRGDLERQSASATAAPPTRKRKKAARQETDDVARRPTPALRWLAAGVLGLTGFASLMHEIVWTRILSLLLGPTVYAFAATLAAVVGGVAIGSAIGAWGVGRTRQPALWLAGVLALAALATTVTSSLAGREIPRVAVAQLADASMTFESRLWSGVALTAALIMPTAISLGAAFPFALAVVGATRTDISSRFGLVYAINTVGAVSGSLAAGFFFIPVLGLQATLTVVSACLIVAALAVTWCAAQSLASRALAGTTIAAAALLLVFSPGWDRELLASGAYLYAPFVPKDLPLDTLLRAGTLLYYREGAASTVSVKRLTGTTTLAVDGKTDASNRGDMVTQKLVAHLPLLLHESPKRVGIVGLGSGVTLGAALSHPVDRADVLEISPEVVEASRFFLAENNDALADPRTNLIVGDGRSHLVLTRQQYDVIISEPSNPWIAGVAALFTREFFQAARDRLAPGGVICQWANAYTISDANLRAIVATFRSVFPDGTVWLVGTEDVLMVGSAGPRPIGERLGAIASHWQRPGVAADLAEVEVREPFSLLSLYAGGPDELAAYAGDAMPLDDDRMTLEFSGPRDILHGESAGNSAALGSLRGDGGPAVIREAMGAATASAWRNRAAMMARLDAHTVAYDDYLRALRLDRGDAAALGGFVRTATLLRRGREALIEIKALTASDPERPAVLIAMSKLQAASGAPGDALVAARRAASLAPADAAALEQVASILADQGDVTQLDAAIDAMRAAAPATAPTRYYEGVLALLRDRPADTVRLAAEAIAIDADYAAVYDLLGAAQTKLGNAAEAQAAFETSLRFDARDSTAYTNLGLLALAAGSRDRATRHFAEALWLEPESRVAREGLARAMTRTDLVP
jgi:spermidine synthase